MVSYTSLFDKKIYISYMIWDVRQVDSRLAMHLFDIYFSIKKLREEAGAAHSRIVQTAE
jgi:hypothetical protein